MVPHLAALPRIAMRPLAARATRSLISLSFAEAPLVSKQMTNVEPTWDNTRSALDSRLDGVLLFPPCIYVVGLFEAGTETLGLALWAWLGAALIWTPWIILRTAMNGPPWDPYRATAFLGFGLAPWALVLLLIEPLSTRTGLIIAFPVIYLWGATAMAIAGFGLLRPKSPQARRRSLVAGALVYALFAAILLVGVFFAPLGGILGTVAFVLAAFAALAAICLAVAPPQRSAPARQH